MLVWVLDVQSRPSSIDVISHDQDKLYVYASNLVMINRYIRSTPTLHIENMSNV